MAQTADSITSDKAKKQMRFLRGQSTGRYAMSIEYGFKTKTNLDHLYFS